MISDEFRDGAAGYYSQEYFVLKDGPIKSVKDLKGKVIGTNAAGSAVDVATRAMLRKHGLEDKRDYTVIEAPFPTMRAMLAEKKVDIIPDVCRSRAIRNCTKSPRPLFSQKEAIGVTQMIIWAARDPFIEKNRAAMVDFMEDTLRIVRWYLDPEKPEGRRRDRLLGTKQPAERFGWLFTNEDYYRDPNIIPNLEALQRNLDMTTDLGFLKGKVDLTAHVDSFPRQRGSRAHQIG